ncbi:MAG: hypothetical protein AB4057_12145 [Crocosphaera sp.]
MNSSAYIAYWTLPPIVITSIFIILFILLLAPYAQKVSFLGIEIEIPETFIFKRYNKKYYYLIIIFFIVIFILLFIPILPFSCETTTADFSNKNPKEKIVPEQRVVKKEKLYTNIRTYPSVNSRPVYSIINGTKIKVINIKFGWIRINKFFDENNQPKNVKGFIAANRTKVALDCPRLLRKLPNDFQIK